MNGAVSRAWFFPTSPRSPYILQDELRLLKALEGRVWDADAQRRFAEILAEQRGHSVTSFKDPAFSARDRVTRGPRLLGFVHLPKRGVEGQLTFTAAGNQLLDLEDPSYLYQRQLAKVQFGSPLHDTGNFRTMRIRPMLAVIALVEQLGSVSKEELALFALTTTDYTQLHECAEAIVAHREGVRRAAPGRERKLYRKMAAEQRISEVFKDDINRGHIHIREGDPYGSGLSRFITTKYRNLRDYADATIRYLVASGIFTLSPLTQRLDVAGARSADARYLLDSVGLAPVEYAGVEYNEYVLGYLGNPDLPRIRRDQESMQIADFKKMVAMLPPAHAEVNELKGAFERAPSRNERLAVLHSLERLLAEAHTQEQSHRIATDRSATLSDIQRLYREVASRSGDIVDRPLMYEWNTWRAMVLVNDAFDVRGNFKIDVDGNPLTTAAGKVPDIVVEYSSFWLVVEVTLQGGYKQYEAEGESIVRHVGMIQRERLSRGDGRPVYALFVSEKVNDTVVLHLQAQARYSQELFGGRVKIVPMDRTVFEEFVVSVTRAEGYSSEDLRRRLDAMFSEDALAQDSKLWASAASAWSGDLRESLPEPRGHE